MKFVMKLVAGLLLLICCAPITGCVGLVQHAVLTSNRPTYAETEKAWPKIEEGKGRVVVFFPDIGQAKTIGQLIDFDNNYEIPLTDRTFIFIDLPAGQHRLRYGKFYFRAGDIMEFDLAKGELKYIKIKTDYNVLGTVTHSPAKEVSVDEATKELGKGEIRHRYKEAIPLDQMSPADRHKSV
jgi:hypothetical protein